VRIDGHGVVVHELTSRNPEGPFVVLIQLKKIRTQEEKGTHTVESFFVSKVLEGGPLGGKKKLLLSDIL
jgi:hypothetical protein